MVVVPTTQRMFSLTNMNFSKESSLDFMQTIRRELTKRKRINSFYEAGNIEL